MADPEDRICNLTFDGFGRWARAGSQDVGAGRVGVARSEGPEGLSFAEGSPGHRATVSRAPLPRATLCL